MLNRVMWWLRRRMKRGGPTCWRMPLLFFEWYRFISNSFFPSWRPVIWRAEWRSVCLSLCLHVCIGAGGGGGVWMETAFRYISIIALSTLDMSYLWQRSVDVDDLISPNLGSRTRSASGCHVLCGGCRRLGETECTSKQTPFIFLQKSSFPR